MLGRSELAAVLASTVLISSSVPAYAEPNKQILGRAEAYKEPALKLLEVLVNTDSGSGDDKGLNAVAEPSSANSSSSAHGLKRQNRPTQPKAPTSSRHGPAQGRAKSC